MCLQEMVGSGFPLAVQMSHTLLPSFTVMSEEMSYILGGTRKKECKNTDTRSAFQFCNHLHHLYVILHENILLREKINDGMVDILTLKTGGCFSFEHGGRPPTLGQIILGNLYSDSMIQSDIVT